MASLFSKNVENSSDLQWIYSLWQRPIKRLFWIDDVPSHSFRGGHRHLTCQMVLHCPVGSAKIYVQTPSSDQHFVLQSADQYLLVNPEDWRLMYDFRDNARLLVMATNEFSHTVYINEPYRPVLLAE